MAARLVEALPEFTKELQTALIDAGEPALAAQVSDLEIVERCGCGTYGCATFSTVQRPTPESSYSIELEASGRGTVIVDLIDNVIGAGGHVIVGEPGPKIVGFEVLNRSEIADDLARLDVPARARHS